PRIAANYANNPSLVPFDFPELIAGLAPRAFFTSSPVRDDNFEVSGVRDTMEQATRIYRLHSAQDKLQAIYPESAHDFPPEAREQAYRFIDRILNLPN
ncbi:MAG: alpha/beta hydrolase, partial [Pirellula sp.]